MGPGRDHNWTHWRSTSREVVLSFVIADGVGAPGRVTDGQRRGGKRRDRLDHEPSEILGG